MIEELTGKVKKFSIFCHDNLSIEDLAINTFRACSEIDCDDWDINGYEWHAAMNHALEEKIHTIKCVGYKQKIYLMENMSYDSYKCKD